MAEETIIQGFSYLTQQTIVVRADNGEYERTTWEQHDEAVRRGAKRLTASTKTVHLATSDEEFDRLYDAGLPVEERRLILYDRDASEAQPGYPHHAPPIECQSWPIDEAPASLMAALDYPS